MTNPINAFGSAQVDLSLSEAWNYEATVDQVETIIGQIETGELELAEVFQDFATAVQYLRQCEAFLAQRQKQMDLLIETLADESDF
ncbi:MAG TPA: exodeoxyribonuclease VII small subunit [Coleofasciculaceae cyanobacterium]